ncbi:MAG: hypothetical protein HY536_00820, partial [Candidatus Colwellbacteria bacterium]|nr:hypothetical protein [Candidatus Colwellbacteria bacterium]
ERGIEREKVRVLLRRFMLIGPAEWFMYFILTLTSLFVYVSRALAGVFLVFDVRTHSFYLPFPQTLHEVAIQILSLSAFPLLFFSLFLLFRYKRFIAGWVFRARLVAPFVWFIFSILFVLPFTFFIYPLPFVYAVFVQFVLRRGKRVESLWVKTPRTVEAG